MGIDAWIVLGIIALAVFFFATEMLSVDLVAILIITSLAVTGVLTPKQSVSGFSNPATLTVAAMFVLSSALFKTGAVSLAGPKLAEIIKSNYTLGMLGMMIAVGVISAFINNTPVVAVFIPVVVRAASAAKVANSRLLIPLSYASIFGGTCTLIGTSTNILVSGIMMENGLDGLSMFDLLPMGLCFFVVGITYMTFIGKNILPDRGSNSELSDKFQARDYITEIILLENAESVGKRIMDSTLVKELEMDIIELQRNGTSFPVPAMDMELHANDRLKVRCDIEKIKALKEKIRGQSSTQPQLKIANDHFRQSHTSLVELVITANSELDGKTLKDTDFIRKYRAIVLAIKHREEIIYSKLTDTVLRAGDVLLVEIKKHRLEALKKQETKKETPFIILSEEGILDFHRRKFAVVATVLTAVIISASTGLIPIMTAALGGVGVLVLTRAISMPEVYNAIDWKIIFLLAGTLSLGVGMKESGAASAIASFFTNTMEGISPRFLLAGLYLLTIVLTEIMSNNASAALIAPIAIALGQSMGMSPTPFVMAVVFAASASFMTPIGYQTNTMVYGAGQYRFTDYIKVGTPLSLMFWLLAIWLIPVFFPFNG